MGIITSGFKRAPSVEAMIESLNGKLPVVCGGAFCGQATAPSPANACVNFLRFIIDPSSLTQPHLFGRLQAYDRAGSLRRLRRIDQKSRSRTVQRVAKPFSSGCRRWELFIHEGVGMRFSEHLVVDPRKSHLKFSTLIRQLVLFDQMRILVADATAGNRVQTGIVETDGIHDQRVPAPTADRVA